ncbi:MAG: TIGR03905 family TSCPD domain-containing protein [Bacilli bacterium]
MPNIYTFKPHGVCSRQMIITYENDTILDLEVVGGCSGNLRSISSLVKGMKLEEAINRLKGIKCGFKSTSCPDQLSIAFKEILNLK